MTLTEVLVYVFLLAAIVWIGGAAVGTLLGGQMRRSGGAPALGTYCAAFATVAAPVFGLSSLIVLGTGLGIVLQDGGPQFQDGWVLGAFFCWLVGMLLGATFVGWTWTKVGKEIDGGASLEQVQPLISKATLLTWIDVLVLCVGLLLVVWRPGA